MKHAPLPPGAPHFEPFCIVVTIGQFTASQHEGATA